MNKKIIYAAPSSSSPYHLDTINNLLERHNLEGVFPVAALAKKEETIFRKGKEPNKIDRIGRVLSYLKKLTNSNICIIL